MSSAILCLVSSPYLIVHINRNVFKNLPPYLKIIYLAYPFTEQKKKIQLTGKHQFTLLEQELTLWYSTISSVKSKPSGKGIPTPCFVHSKHKESHHHPVNTQSVHPTVLVVILLLMTGTTEICNIVFRGAWRGISWKTKTFTDRSLFTESPKCIYRRYSR